MFYSNNTNDESNVLFSDWEKTSLKPYVEMLEKHAMGLMGEVRKDRLANGKSFRLFQ